MSPFSNPLRRSIVPLLFSNGAGSAQRDGISNFTALSALSSQYLTKFRGPLQVSFNGQRYYSTAAQVASLEPPPTDSLPSWESGPPAGRSRSQTNSFYDVTVEKYAAKPLSPLTLKKMLSFGESMGGEQLERKVIKSAQFVQSELPVRLAKRLLDLQLLPYIVVTNPHIKRVYDAYHRAFLVLKDFPEVTSMEQNQYLTALLTKLVDEHGPLLTSLAKGLKECTTRPLVGPSLSLDPFLDNMLRSRISRRVIAEQHICFQQRREGYIGVICTELSVAQILGAAIARTEQVCRDTYGTHPQFQVTGDADTVFSYIPAHLDYMFFEILKNASRAVVEHHSRIAGSRGTRLPLKSTAMPPIVAQVCKGTREVTIKISDQGGGIDEEVQPKIWKYGYTSVDPTISLGSSSASPVADFRTGAAMDPMAGLGFGLPVSRLYAQYFGGNIELMSIPGYGTDVYLRIHRLGNQSEYVEI
ncbi:mitochondrial pyruvate dehydrogenase kinase [Klebsormidium nitens]|uniref:Protein-serine/threonine kinase n=1 Tax=Klebsormidium nitens TaxID=105231 RepID=A0A1Y1I768_KLENI|nr:mitochondrial pyruvate dehydrogenase kinase [Klebsormidium nitens]|eukprot:GAQ83948.1 mitochondrial pyruvate dehydrogenase kinase [Klebsormidium nitens]